jgi:hypothetical protein
VESAEHLAAVFASQQSGIQLLLWEEKLDLVRSLLVLQSTMTDLPESPTLLPTKQSEIQLLSILLCETPESETRDRRRVLILPQASTESIGPWLNGWRGQLAQPPGTILVVRSGDFHSLTLRAPDLMSFALSGIHDTTGLLPLAGHGLTEHFVTCLPRHWQDAVDQLPGSRPTDEEIDDWIQRFA